MIPVNKSVVKREVLYSIAGVLTLFLCCSCPHHGPYPVENHYFSRGFVPLYGYVSTFYSSCHRLDTNEAGTQYRYNQFSDSISIRCAYGRITNSTDSVVWCQSAGEERLKFDSLSDLHGDTSYHQSVTCTDVFCRTYGNYQFENPAPMSDIISINVYSEQDFDDEHSAGQSLNDLIMFRGLSLMPYIRSHYSEFVPQYSPVEKLLAEMRPEDYELCIFGIHCFDLKFVSLPTAEPAHKIHIDIEMSDGRSFSCTNFVRIN